MKRRDRKKKSSSVKTLRLWTQTEVIQAFPYLHSVINSLREHWLEMQSQKCKLERLANKPVPHDRTHLLAEADAQKAKDQADARFQESIAELSAIDVFLINPNQGVALIPFRKADELAWYVYDQYATYGLVGWRYHQDPLVQRRPLELLCDAPALISTNPGVA